MAFLSDDRLLPGQSATPGKPQVFLYDRIARTLTLASRQGGVPTAGLEGGAKSPSLSADGRYVAFLGNYPKESFLPAQPDVFVFDRITGTTVLASPSRRAAGTGAGRCSSPILSANGQAVAFLSASPDLAEGDLNRNQADAFLFRTAPPGPVTLPTCTLLDTRQPAGAPALRSDVSRQVAVRGRCGVPASASAVLIRLTALQGTGKGNVQVATTATSAAVGTLRFNKNQTRSATYTVPLAADGSLVLLPFVAGKGTVQATLEATGYLP